VFLHYEERLVDKGKWASISFKGRKYEAKLSLIGCKVVRWKLPMPPSIMCRFSEDKKLLESENQYYKDFIRWMQLDDKYYTSGKLSTRCMMNSDFLITQYNNTYTETNVIEEQTHIVCSAFRMK